MQIAIVYDSGYGHTEKLANHVAQGVQEVEGAQPKLFAVANGVDWESLEASDAIIFGSPTYNGSISARLKGFMEESTRTAWIPQKWRNKVAAGFTNSGSQHGDKLNSLMSMVLFAAQHGMIWVGMDLFPGKTDEELNRIGSWLGSMAFSQDAPADVTPSESDLKTAAYLGKRVAEITAQFAGGKA